MKIQFHGNEMDVQLQHRQIVICRIRDKGEVLFSTGAICAPKDKFDPRTGEEIAVHRMAEWLDQVQAKAGLSGTSWEISVDAMTGQILEGFREGRKKNAKVLHSPGVVRLSPVVRKPKSESSESSQRSKGPKGPENSPWWVKNCTDEDFQYAIRQWLGLPPLPPTR